MASGGDLTVVLSELALTLLNESPGHQVLDHLVDRIVEVLPIRAAGVTLDGGETSGRSLAASSDAAREWERLQIELGEGPSWSGAASRESVQVPDLACDDRYPRFATAVRATGPAAVFTFPLRYREARLGTLALYCDRPGPLEPGDTDAAQTLADVAAAYVVNAQARDEATATTARLQHRALHDSLTGLANRALLGERLEHAAQRARRSHTTTAVLFVDIDDFKRVNDTHGHSAGDELLRAIAGRLAGLTRSGDTLARLSGDEFVFLCEELHDAADAELVAERVATAFAQAFLVAGAPLKVTASIGVAVADQGEEISDQLVMHADRAMYQVKRRGGDGHQSTDWRDRQGPPRLGWLAS